MPRKSGQHRRYMALYRACLPVLMTAICLFLSSSMTVQAAQPVQQSPNDITFGLGIGYLNGNTLYHISSYDTTGQGIESELEFPLQTFFLDLEGEIISKDGRGRDEFKVRFQWLTNIDSASGQLKDSDWATDAVDIATVGAAHPGLDIYSTSDIKLKANIIDVRGSLNAWRSDSFTIGPLGGFLYQKFHFDASNVHQVGYGPYNTPSYTGSVSGPVLTYDVTYTILYLGIHSEMQFDKRFQTIVDIGYSPWASAEDRDDHLLRHKVSEAKTTGNAYLVEASMQWALENSNALLLRGKYVKIDTTGTQTQRFYDGSGDVFTGIGDKITSQQTAVTFLFSHRF